MIDLICRVFSVKFENQNWFARWRYLVERHQVQGVAVHDSRLAAAALELGVRGILTGNERDFKRYEVEGLRVLRPESILRAMP